MFGNHNFNEWLITKDNMDSRREGKRTTSAAAVFKTILSFGLRRSDRNPHPAWLSR